MRLRIVAEIDHKTNVPFNYQAQIQACIYKLMEKASPEYTEFLHDIGFIDENKHLKLFAFSKLKFYPMKINPRGFSNVIKIEFLFSTPVEKSFQNLVLGLFDKNNLNLIINNHSNIFNITQVETLPEPEFTSKMKCVCLSPICISTGMEVDGKFITHFLDYMKSDERPHFIENIKNNLLRKYRILNNQDYPGEPLFDFAFDPEYIVKKKGKISKLIHFNKNNKIIAMEAPFTIETDSKLIKIGYDCGFGIKNSAGFGMCETINCF